MRQPQTAAELVALIEDCWRLWRAEIARLDSDTMDRPTQAGWTVKQMLGHVAFWMETVEPVLVGMFRGQSVDDRDWYGGGELGLSGEWPRTDVHNGREAAWAASLPSERVVERMDRAYERMVAITASLSADEMRDDRYVGKIWDASCAHYRVHLPELPAL